jgi:hypothetical protein
VRPRDFEKRLALVNFNSWSPSYAKQREVGFFFWSDPTRMKKTPPWMKWLIYARIHTEPFVILLILTAFVASWLGNMDDCLIKEQSPKGFFSLQKVTTRAEADSIYQSWTEVCAIHKEAGKHTGDSVARNVIYIDTFAFIPLYAALLLVIILKWDTRTGLKVKWRLVALLSAVVIADVTENVLSWLFLAGMPWNWLMLLATTFKWVCLLALLIMMTGFIRAASNYASNVLRILWTFRIVVLSLLVLYLALWQSDQGQDLLINLTFTNWGAAIFFLCISLCAFLHWHLPKFISANNTLDMKPTSLWGWIKLIFHGSLYFVPNVNARGKVIYPKDSDLARAFGVLTFLIPAFGILNVMDKYALGNYYPNYYLLACILLMAAALENNWLDNIYKYNNRFKNFVHVVVPCVIGLMIFGWFFEMDLKPRLWVLFSEVLALGFLFFLMVSVRTNVPVTIFKIPMRWLRKVRISWFMYGTLLMAAIFLLANFFPLFLATSHGEETRFSTISVVLSGLVFYVLFFATLKFWGLSLKINVTGIFFAIALVFAVAFENEFHDVTVVDDNLAETNTLESYVSKWLADRDELIRKYNSGRDSTAYPVFIVSNYGGGIRAAAWTSLAVAHLDQITNDSTDGNALFQDHVFAYSGASGGTIGASVMCALRKQDPKKAPSIEKLKEFYRNDFLSPVVIGLIGRDFFASTFGVDLDDRAVSQEEVWEHHMEHTLSCNVYSQSFRSIYNDCSTTPLLFSNTTHVERGVKGLVAPLLLSNTAFPTAIMVADSVAAENGKQYSLKLSTAAFFSARFPFISPAGRVSAFNHFLDGGIYENSGGETAAEIEAAFSRIANEKYPGMVKVIVVSLKNFPPHLAQNEDKNLFELSAPLKALVANVDGNALHADSTNAVRYSQQGRYFRLYPRAGNRANSVDDHNAILPLGWQLSERALRRLNDNFVNPDAEMKATITRMMKLFRKDVSTQEATAFICGNSETNRITASK